MRQLQLYLATGGLVAALFTAEPASAQKPGGILRMPIGQSPASMSIHEEATRNAVTPMMGVFNNLVLFDQHVAQNTFESIRPDLAESWSWDEDKTALTFRLHTGVKWHDGAPFTAKDVKCTWDTLAGWSSEKLRVNPRKSWYRNLAEVTVNGDNEVTFHLQRPQPSLLALLASGASPVYPCHVPPAQMRQHPIGTGPFKFVEFKPNESIKVARNPEYWKPGRPYLDGIEYSAISNLSTQMLAFAAGKFDMTFPFGVSIPLLKDVKTQAPQAMCDLVLDNGSRTMIVNRGVPPFDNADLRRAMALSLDRKAFVDILTEGQGTIGGAMSPPLEGVWGMPPDELLRVPIYAADVQANRGQARALMEKLGYGPAKRLVVTVSTRNAPPYRESAVLMIDQLKEIYIDGHFELIETANWFPKVIRRNYSVAFTITETALDDPDQMFYENYVCGAERNYTGYCNPEFDKLVDRQSIEADTAKRRELVWQIERMLADEMVRPVIFYTRAATCWLPQVKGLTLMVNSLFNGWRFEDLWLDK
jgi:peptide/nickel transport system substrate-binding protein